MNDLISRKALLEDMRKIEYMNIDGQPMVAGSVMLMLIDSQLTAYDPDKVVEALKKEVPKILGHEYGSSYKALKIIEIVKKGGV